MSSNMNIRLLTSSASSGSSASRPSTMSRSVARSDRLMIWTSGSTPPTRGHLGRLQHRGQLALERRLEPLRMHLRRGPVHHRDAGARPRPAGRGRGRTAPAMALSPGMCASTRAMTCGCSSAMNEQQLARVGAVEELERQLHRGRGEPGHDRRRRARARATPRAARGRTPGRRRAHVGARGASGRGTPRAPRRSRPRSSASSARISAEIASTSASGRSRGLGGLLLAELDQQDRGLADAGLVQRSWSCQRSDSTSQPRSSCATSSGWRSTIAAISSRAAVRSWLGAEPVSSAAAGFGGSATVVVVAQPQLLDDVRRGLVAQLAALAAAEPGEQHGGHDHDRRCRRS